MWGFFCAFLSDTADNFVNLQTNRISMSIPENIKRIMDTIPKGVQLVAVSKTKPNEAITEAYSAGQRVFGENKVQDLVRKNSELPADIKWHYIGHLQTNKVKALAPFIHLIEAVDSLKLLKVIDREAKNCNRKINILLQFHIATEESKFGLSYPEAEAILNSSSFAELHNINVMGVMGMATYTDDQQQVRNEFATLAQIFQKLKNQFFANSSDFREISMGMSGDYPIAIEEGATMVRVGTAIFGARNY